MSGRHCARVPKTSKFGGLSGSDVWAAIQVY